MEYQDDIDVDFAEKPVDKYQEDDYRDYSNHFDSQASATEKIKWQNEGLENPLGDPLKFKGQVKPKNRRIYKAEKLLEEQNGIKQLFKEFVMNPETTQRLRGKAGYEEQDLRKVMATYQGWHLKHYPLYTFEHFAWKLKQFAKTGKPKDDVRGYLAKLRNHYTGDEMIYELMGATNTMPDQKQDASNYTLFKKMADQKTEVNLGSSKKQSGPKVTLNQNSQQSFGFQEAEPAQPIVVAPEPKMTLSFDPNQLTEEQKKMIEEKRQIALSKKRKRQELEAQQQLFESGMDEQTKVEERRTAEDFEMRVKSKESDDDELPFPDEGIIQGLEDLMDQDQDEDKLDNMDEDNIEMLLDDDMVNLEEDEDGSQQSWKKSQDYLKMTMSMADEDED